MPTSWGWYHTALCVMLRALNVQGSESRPHPSSLGWCPHTSHLTNQFHLPLIIVQPADGTGHTTKHTQPHKTS